MMRGSSTRLCCAARIDTTPQAPAESKGHCWNLAICTYTALFSSLYGVATRGRHGAPPLRWEKCVLNDLGVVGVPEEDWEGKCQLKCVWRKMLWEFSHPGQESRPLRASGRRGQQPAVLLITFPRVSSSCSRRRGQPVLVGANSSSHQGFA